MTELDDRLREHFADMALSPEALARIHAWPPPESVPPRRRATDRAADGARPERLSWLRLPARSIPGQRVPGRLAPGSRLALAFTLVAVLAVGMHVDGSLGERSERTLTEIAVNHATRLTFEFEEPSLAELDEKMQLLPFEMAAPARMPSDVEVLGSRYCTLAGNLAAHVKVRDRVTGRPVSLFVTSVSPELERLDGDVGRIDGVEVRLFREGGLFYAMARQAG